MSTLSTNPLAKHFRQPILYIKLPSQGRWYAPGAIDIPVNGEVPIYSMSAKDEITMKTPDALLNGASTAQVVQSCCPAIKDPWAMPVVDLDPILIAIRIASYGPQLDFTAICPHCGTKNEHGLDLQFILGKVQPADWSSPVATDGLTIKLKPQTYKDYTESSLMSFEEQKLLKVVSDDSLNDEDKSRLFNDLFNKVLATGVNQVSKSIESITTEDGTVVTDQQFIQEFLNNCDRSVWDNIKERLDDIRKQNAFNEVTIPCSNTECSKEFVTPFAFEQTNFFD